jgi:hypothetical protein
MVLKEKKKEEKKLLGYRYDVLVVNIVPPKRRIPPYRRVPPLKGVFHHLGVFHL